MWSGGQLFCLEILEIFREGIVIFLFLSLGESFCSWRWSVGFRRLETGGTLELSPGVWFDKKAVSGIPVVRSNR